MKIKAYVKLLHADGVELSYKNYRPVKAKLKLVKDFTLVNTKEIKFPPCIDQGGFVTDLRICDKHGQILYDGKLNFPVYIGIGVLNNNLPVIPTFAVGTLKIKTDKGKKHGKS